MTARELLGISTRALRRRALRSCLTALTAAVAVGTVSATRALIRGSEVGLEEDLGRLGLRTLQVSDDPVLRLREAPPSRAEPLGPADSGRAREGLRAAGVEAVVVEARVSLGLVSAVDAVLPGGAASAEGPSIPVPVIATGPEYAATFEASLREGRFLEAADLREGAPPVCVLDAETAEALGRGGRAGGEVTIRGAGGERRARVVGVLEDPFRLRPLGHSPDMIASARHAIAQVLAFRNAYVPAAAAPSRGTQGSPPGAGLLLAVVARREEASRAHDALEAALGTEERGLVVWSRGTWARGVLEAVTSLATVVNVVWGVVLAVALVMIATVTTVSVRERTAEVAIRRAEGATRAAVVLQLLVEGGLLALLGGLAGMPLGLVAADGLAALLTWQPRSSAADGALAVGLGVVVGILAAAIPAARASRFDVVEGLRRAG